MRNRWVFMAYRLPREPSAPRLALWRALRRLGALQVSDGLVALPHSPRNLEHLEWLAAGIVDDGATASVWLAQPTSGVTHSELAAAMRRAADEEYRAVTREAEEVSTMERAPRRRAVRRLRAQLRRVGSRDYFEAPAGQEARSRVERLAQLAEVEA
jgi:hypothetical protein